MTLIAGLLIAMALGGVSQAITRLARAVESVGRKMGPSVDTDEMGEEKLENLFLTQPHLFPPWELKFLDKIRGRKYWTLTDVQKSQVAIIFERLMKSSG